MKLGLARKPAASKPAKELFIHGLVTNFTFIYRAIFEKFPLESLNLVRIEIVEQVLLIRLLYLLVCLVSHIMWFPVVIMRFRYVSSFHFSNLVRQFRPVLRVVILDRCLVAVREYFLHRWLLFPLL